MNPICPGKPSWEVTQPENGVVDVIPMEDLRMHLRASKYPRCHCHPRYERMAPGTWLITHRSYDGREILEVALVYAMKARN
jgi:hypothetical protein